VTIDLNNAKRAILRRRTHVLLGTVLAAIAVFVATAVDTGDGQLKWRTAMADVAAGDSVTVEDGTVGSTPGAGTGTTDTINVTVFISATGTVGSGGGGDGLGAYQFTLDWDPTHFIVNTLTQGADHLGGFTPGAIDNGTGTTNFLDAVSGLTGPEGTLVMAQLQVEGRCAADGAYPLTLTVNNIADPGFAAITHTANSGTITCTAYTVPGAPTIGMAVAGNQAATVVWTAPASDGNSPITGYTVTQNPGGTTTAAGATATSTQVTDLTNGTPYTFTVTATNLLGTSPPSETSNTVTPLATVPDAPTAVVAIPGFQQADVSWTAPFDGNRAILYYTVISSPSAAYATSTITSATMTGLTNATPYTFTVSATNAVGTSATSTASAAVTPGLFDYGDAPDPPYPSLLLSGGARHIDVSTVWLGYSADRENDSVQVDLDLFDDGLLGSEPLEVQVQRVSAATDAYLNVLVDANDDGDWADAGEWVVQNVDPFALAPTATDVTYIAASVDLPLNRWIRLTVTDTSIASYDGTGMQSAGETEDYELTSALTSSNILYGVGVLPQDALVAPSSDIPLTALPVAQDGTENPYLPGVTYAWSVISGSGSLSSATARETVLTVGSSAGDVVVKVIASQLYAADVMDTTTVTVVAPAAPPEPTVAPVNPPEETPVPVLPTPVAGVEQTVVTPAEGASLETTDGDASIDIPPGATTDAYLGVQIVPVEEDVVVDPDTGEETVVPPPPLAFSVGSTVINIVFTDDQGVPLTNVVLDRPVQVCVAYTDEDAAAADGGAFGLEMLRYADPPGEWVALNTTVDPLNKKLCAYTTRFSLFAVGIAKAPVVEGVILPATGGWAPSSGQITALIGVGVVFAGAGLFALRRRRSHA